MHDEIQSVDDLVVFGVTYGCEGGHNDQQGDWVKCHATKTKT